MNAEWKIANATVFLASDSAPTLVGSQIVLDGGMDIQQLPATVAV